MKGRKKSTDPIKTSTLTVRLTEEEKQQLHDLAVEFGIPKSKIVGSLLEGRKMLFISYTPLGKPAGSTYRLARTLSDALAAMKLIRETGGEIVLIGWLVKINIEKFPALEGQI